ncbi:MAG TPA: hypothetical protein VHT52_17140 [Stellaceae bacterium]|nr:hypothetical protein [Stellaceae bacterium]
MTDETVGERIERMLDHLDRLRRKGQIGKREYDFALAQLYKWAEQRRREQCGKF